VYSLTSFISPKGDHLMEVMIAAFVEMPYSSNDS